MIFNDHTKLAGMHAILSASKYHWVNYTDQKMEAMFTAQQAAARGTRFHALAAELIRMRVRQARNGKTLNMYVNDALGFQMTPEQTLFYSINCFGTADAISYRNNKLRIHDLKMGITQTSVHQLEVYAAIFCLEYRIDPQDIDIELRIYQNDAVRIYEGDPEVIANIMARIVYFDDKINRMRLEELA